jgi:MFS family permease
MATNSLVNEFTKPTIGVTSNYKRFNPFSLDAINFLLVDVRGALGPYLDVFLVTQRHWSQTENGLLTAFGGLLGLAAQTPIGGMIDATCAKRGVIVLALAVLAIGTVTIFASPTFWLVTIANGLTAVFDNVFGPAVAALTLGLYPQNRLARRIRRAIGPRAIPYRAVSDHTRGERMPGDRDQQSLQTERSETGE